MNYRHIAIAGLVTMTVGCGGGGGGGGSINSFAGVWSGQLELTTNPCGANVDPVLYPILTINQDERHVVVESNSGDTFEGTATDERLSVQKTTPTDCSAGNGSATVSIDMDRHGHESSAITILSVSSTCGPFTCSDSYLGTVERS